MIRAFLILLAILTTQPAYAAIAVSPQPYTTQSAFSGAKWTTAYAGTALNLANYALTFDDEFNGPLDCVQGSFSGPSGQHKWYSYGSYGNAVFTSCAAITNNPCVVSGGQLNITVSYVGGQWQSCELVAQSPYGEGFNQQYGVFTARIMLPATIPTGMSLWPSFWQLSRYNGGLSNYTYTELDTFENFGMAANHVGNITTSFYEWPASSPASGKISAGRTQQFTTAENIYDGNWHTYTTKWTPTWRIVYLDGVELYRIPTIGQESNPAMYPIIDLNLYTDNAASPAATYTMSVDYVRVYACTAASWANC